MKAAKRHLVKSRILVNALITNDGTMIRSFSRHDYKTHKNIDGTISFIDGGLDYVRYGNGIPITITEDDSFETIRVFLTRGGRGETGTEPLKYVPLYKVNDAWLDNIIIYEAMKRPNNIFLPYYIKEKSYREKHKITVE